MAYDSFLLGFRFLSDFVMFFWALPDFFIAFPADLPPGAISMRYFRYTYANINTIVTTLVVGMMIAACKNALLNEKRGGRSETVGRGERKNDDRKPHISSRPTLRDACEYSSGEQ